MYKKNKRNEKKALVISAAVFSHLAALCHQNLVRGNGWQEQRV